MSLRHGRSVQSPSLSGAASPANSQSFSLEISRGRTAQPLRPIQKDRFLIGAGDWCDLTLGGTRIPTLHSVIHRDGGDLWIDAVAAEPVLKINGHALTFAALEPGDLIEIGDFQLKLRGSAKAASEPKAFVPPKLSQAEEMLGEEDPLDQQDLEDLSASELVDLIESEMELIEEFDRRKKRGAAALLDAIRRHGPKTAEVSTAPSTPKPAIAKPQPVVATAPSKDLLTELEAAIQSLNRFALDLEHRSAGMNSTEVRSATRTLLEVQDQIVSRLDQVLAKIAAMRRPQAPAKPRREVA